MIQVNTQALAELLRGELIGAEVDICGASIDARSLQPGALFFALQGETSDGHDYLNQALAAGASAAVVECRVDDSVLPQIIVGNARQALGQLAAWWRTQLNCKIVAVTGSNGKTTVKEMLAAILSQCGNTLATLGNFNNDLGMPLTLLRISKEHDYAVLEMGANHFGEVEYMVHIAKPDVALVNNAGPAHLEGFGDISGVARAKGEIYSGLGPQGIAVINADDSKADVWRSLCADKSTRTFALDTSADVAGVWSALDHELVINTEGESVAVQLNLLGRHNALNALAASASALALGAGLAAVKTGLESVQAVDGRLKLLTPRSDLQLIDDSYNANPASLLAGAQVAVDMDQSEAWLVLGDLGELGGDVAQVHANLGGQLKQKGIDRLFTLGSYSAHTARVFNEGAASFDSINELLNAVNQALAEAEGTITVLVKGSRSSRMERVVQALALNETTGDQ